MQRKDLANGGCALESRTILIDGRTHQLRIEPSYWEALDEICFREKLALPDLCSDLLGRLGDTSSQRSAQQSEAERVSLANAIRVFTVGYFRQAATENGHDQAGHGRGDPFVATPFDNERPHDAD
jgi:predicted DNA-binding ribbon-helix-helix protein